jgi:hypothetical protein
MSDGRPPPEKPEPPPATIWDLAARALAADPDSPLGLQVQSAFNRAVQPRVDAVQQLVEALALQIETPGAQAEAAVAAAIAHWEAATDSKLDESLLVSFREDAAALVESRSAGPPALESIVGDVDKTDVGYEMRLHMQGLRGTWHRLWAAIAMGTMLGTGPAQLACIAEVRGQFEAELGRAMTQDEWDALERHALAHGAAVASRGR